MKITREAVRHISRTVRSSAIVADQACKACATDDEPLTEEEWHHPDIHLQWGEVRFEMWTHETDGLHKTDVVVAARMDRIHEDDGPE